MVKFGKSIIGISLSVCFLLTACMATLEHSEASGSLCEVVEANGWGLSHNRKEKGTDYSFSVADSFAWKVTGPIEDVHWIELTGYTAGKLAGYAAPTMIYDPGEAELEVSGKVIKAASKLWESRQIRGQYQPAAETPIPLNLNSMEEGASDSFFIAFPVDISNPKTEYIFRPGTILLDGVRYPLPVYKSCYKPGNFHLYPIT